MQIKNLSFNDLDNTVDGNKTFHLLSIITGIAIYIANISIILCFFTGSIVQRIESNISNNITVDCVISDQKGFSEDIEKLKTVSGVTNAKEIDNNKIKLMLEPWIGKIDIDMQLPTLVEIEGNNINFDDVTNIMSQHASDITMHDHKTWYNPVINTGNTLYSISLAIAILVILCTTFIISIIMNMSLKLHKNTVGILKLIGATDRYIARQFIVKSFIISIKANIVALLPMLASVLVIKHMTTKLDNIIAVPHISYMSILFTLCITSICTLFIVIITTRSSILRTLKNNNFIP